MLLYELMVFIVVCIPLWEL